jgi:hypothetical protein
LIRRLIISLALVVACTGSATAAWVLGPEAEPALRALSASLQAPFLEGDPGPIRVEAGRVTFHVWPERGAPDVVLLTREWAQADGATLESKHGFIAIPTSWDEVRREAALTALNEVDVTLPWIALDGPADVVVESDSLRQPNAKKAAALARARRDAQSLRDRRVPVAPLPALDPALDEDNLATGPRGDANRWVQASVRAESTGYRRLALSLADVATRIAPPSAEASRTWRALRARGGTAPLWPVTWFTLGLIFWLTGTYLLTGGREDNRLRLAVACILCLSFTGLLLAQGRPPERLRPPPTLPSVLEAPLADLCDSDPAQWVEGGLALYAQCAGRDVSFHVEANPDNASGLPHLVRAQGDTRTVEAQSAQQALRLAVASAEVNGFRANRWVGDTTPAYRRLPATGTLDRIEASTALGLILLGAFVLLWLQRAFAGVVWRHMSADKVLQRQCAALGAVWLAVHLFAPGYLVMEYTGYDLTARLAWLTEISRYGAGPAWLYGWAFSLFGVDHTSVQLANRLFGLASLLPMAALLFTLMGKRAVWALTLYVCLPVQWRDHLSEGIMTGTNWLLLSGLAAAVCAWKRTLPQVALPLAFAVWMAAAVCRPEVGVALIPLGLAVTALVCWTTEPERRGRTLFAALSAGVGAGFALWPHVRWLLVEVASQEQSAGIHQLSEATSSRITDVLTGNNFLLDGPWVSPVVLVWIAAALLWRGRERLWSASVILATLLWWSVTSVDLPLVSIPRVHISTWLMLIPVIGLGMLALAERGQRGRWLNIGLGVIVAAHAIWTAPTVLGASNADAEEALIRAAVDAMPSEPGCLATVRFSDSPEPGSTQRHFPEYLFTSHQVLALDRLSEHWPQCQGHTLALLGTRCFMSFRTPDDLVAPEDGEIESCKRFRDRFELEPIETLEQPNRTDFTIPVYPAREALPIGLYRVTGQRPRSEAIDSGSP